MKGYDYKQSTLWKYAVILKDSISDLLTQDTLNHTPTLHIQLVQTSRGIVENIKAAYKNPDQRLLKHYLTIANAFTKDVTSQLGMCLSQEIISLDHYKQLSLISHEISRLIFLITDTHSSKKRKLLQKEPETSFSPDHV